MFTKKFTPVAASAQFTSGLIHFRFVIAGVAIDGGNPDDLENEKQSITMIKRQGKVKVLEEEIDRGKLHPPPTVTLHPPFSHHQHPPCSTHSPNISTAHPTQPFDKQQLTTRMHSSRMCTVRSSSRLLGECLPQCMLGYTPPLGLGLDTPSPGLGLDIPLGRHTPRPGPGHPPGSGPGHPPGLGLDIPPWTELQTRVKT